jgi:hypothetical protein
MTSPRESASSFEPRDGDILVVSYPEVTAPIGGISYSSIKLGGFIYTRKLVVGDNVNEQFTKIYKFLEAKSLETGRQKLAVWRSELQGV